MTPNSYGALLDELLETAAAVGQPLSGTFELTKRCNLRCRMCYVCEAAGDRELRSSELSAQQWLDLGRQAVDAGMVLLLLTGGEILLRPDFLDIYLPLSQLGLHITLFSNGTLVTPELAAALARVPPHSVEITVYGATRQTYEAITGVRGSYDRCLAGLDALLEAGVPVTLKTTITGTNLPEYALLKQMARDRQIPFQAGWMLGHRRDRGACEVDDLRLSAEQVVHLEAADSDVVARWADIEHRSVPAAEGAMTCMAGRASFVVDPSGIMGTCLDLWPPHARPLEVGFAQAWREVQEYARLVPPCPECLDCDVRQYCPGCPGRNWHETGSVIEPDRYCCAIAQMRRRRYTGGPAA